MMSILAQLESSAFGSWLRESGSIWAYPAVLTLHTIGLAVLVGANAVLDLRLLGAAPRIPLAEHSVGRSVVVVVAARHRHRPLHGVHLRRGPWS